MYDTAFKEATQENFFPPHDPQGEEVEILDDTCLAPVHEVLAFARRLDTRLTFSQLRAHICLDYELGWVDARATLQRLWDNGLIRTADDLAFLVSAGVRALAEQMPPEPPASPPGATKGVRVTSRASEMIDALADVRRAREVAA